MVQVDGDAASVVLHGNASFGVQGHPDAVAVAGQGFVHGVVQDFLDEVMHAVYAGGADVHAGTHADGFQSLQNLDLAGVVFVRAGRSCGYGFGRGRSGSHGCSLAFMDWDCGFFDCEFAPGGGSMAAPAWPPAAPAAR